MADLKKELSQLKKELKSLDAKITKLEKLAARTDSTTKKEAPKKNVTRKPQKTAVKKAASTKTAKQKDMAAIVPEESQTDAGTDYSAVISIIKKSKNGVSASDLKKKTGFNDKKIANIIYKAKKKGDIVSPKKGIYTKGN